MRRGRFVLYMAIAMLAGCASENGDERWNALMEGVGKPAGSSAHGYPTSKAITGARGPNSAPRGFAQIGTGEFTGESLSAISAGKAADGSEGYTINLVDAPIAQAAKKILGDIMGYNYLVDPKVTGNITLQTSSPMSRQSLLDILEVSLATNGAAIVKKADRYEIVPISEATASNAIIGSRVPMNEPGMKVQVLQLNYIGADEMREIIEQVSKKSAVLRTDPTRNYIVVAGNNGELAAIREAISVFDVDWMKGMSTALYPPQGLAAAGIGQGAQLRLRRRWRPEYEDNPVHPEHAPQRHPGDHLAAELPAEGHLLDRQARQDRRDE
ncbi:hypothetical protein ABIA15_000769 [Sinorhizobium fredii]